MYEAKQTQAIHREQTDKDVAMRFAAARAEVARKTAGKTGPIAAKVMHVHGHCVWVYASHVL